MEKEANGRLLKQQSGIIGMSCLFVDCTAGGTCDLNPQTCLYVAFCSHEGEMYKSLLGDYEASQKALMVENAELRKVLQQLKKEIMHILSRRQSPAKGAEADDSQEQVSVCFVYDVHGGLMSSGPSLIHHYT